MFNIIKKIFKEKPHYKVTDEGERMLKYCNDILTNEEMNYRIELFEEAIRRFQEASLEKQDTIVSRKEAAKQLAEAILVVKNS